jgi:hypothetical protein
LFGRFIDETEEEEDEEEEDTENMPSEEELELFMALFEYN